MRKRVLSLWLLSPVLFITLLGMLAFSPLATPVFRLVAESAVEGLKVGSVSGSLAGDIRIRNVAFRSEEWEVNIGLIETNVSWRCAIVPRVCVEKLIVDTVSVNQLQVLNAPDSESAAAEFALPVAVAVDNIQLINLRVHTNDMRIDVEHFSTAISAADTITVLAPRLRNINLRLAAPKANAPTTPTSYTLDYQAPELTDITLPVSAEIRDLLVENALIQQGEQQHQVARLAFDTAQLGGHSVSIAQAELVYQALEVNASAEVTLTGSYPLSAEINAHYLSDTLRQRARISAKGALDALIMSIEASDGVELRSEARVNVLADSLPLSVDVTWPAQLLPLMPDYSVDSGSLALAGTLSDYELAVKSAATLPQIGHVPFVASVSVNTQQIDVNELTVRLLDGSISSIGTLFLDTQVYWVGQTQLSDINARPLDPALPSSVQGELNSLIQYSENGLDISVPSLSLLASLPQSPVTVSGDFAYSQPNAIAVGNLILAQQGNQVHASGQVLHNRYLDIDVDAAITDASLLYNDIAGALVAKASITGEWLDPTAKANVSLTNFEVAPQVSKTLSDLGAIQGKIEVDGRLSSHRVSTDLSVGDKFASLSLAGGYQQHQWSGALNRASLDIAAHAWSLRTPAVIEVNTLSNEADVDAHCWQSKQQEALCINALTYQQDALGWDVSASDLAIGRWLHQAQPDIVFTASPSVLNIQSQGSFDKQGIINGQFDAQILPSRWVLGDNGQINIDIDRFTSSGIVTNNALELKTAIHSPQLGQASIRLVGNPLDDIDDADGHIRLSNIDVAPLKPLSDALRQLSGELNGDMRIALRDGKPALFGQLNIANGAIDIDDTPLKLENWQQQIVMNDRHVAFDGKFLLGGGEGMINGHASWQDTPSLYLAVKGDKFEVNQPNIRFKVSPDLRIEADANSLRASGSVNIPWARIEIDALPENAVSPSKDVHLRGEPPPTDPLNIVDASVFVSIDEAKHGEVEIDAFGLNAKLHGAINVKTQPAPVAYGDLQILDGVYAAYGQNLVIQTGEVQFNGPIDQPFLLVEAVRAKEKIDDGVIAGIRIDGPADAPNVNLFSVPAMDQQAVLSYLLTGKAPNAKSEAPNYQALLLGFGLSKTQSLTTQVGDALGIDEFTLTTNEDKLSVSGQINDRLSVQYNVDVGLSNNDTSSLNLRRRQAPPDLALRYKLLPKLFVEAVQNTIEDQSEFAVDLYYEFFINNPKQTK